MSMDDLPGADIWATLTAMQKVGARAYVKAELDRYPDHRPTAAPLIPVGSGATARISASRLKRDRAAFTKACIAIGALLAGALVLRAAFPDRPVPSTPPPPVTVNTQPAAPATPPTSQPGLGLAASSTGTVNPVAGGLDYLGLKAEAEEKLKAVLTDEHGLRYRAVRTKLSTMDGSGIVAFCGQVNARTPLGGYGGYQRFIASRSVATTESLMAPDEFNQAWGRFCDDGVEGPRVWF